MSAPVALVTGASRGIGRQLAIDLARAGYDVVCAARSTSERPGKLPGTIDETVEQVRAAGRTAMAVPLDVRDEERIRELADRVFAELGGLDLLVNNAAIAIPGPALKDTTKHWRLGIDINVNGPFYLMHALCPRMAVGSRVVNISSNASQTPDFGRPSYTTTKRALEALTESLAHELKDRIAVNCIRLELPVWSEGFTFTLPDDVELPFEHPVIMSDAVLWLAKQPVSYTGKILTIAEMRELGAVRPFTPYRGEGSS